MSRNNKRHRKEKEQKRRRKELDARRVRTPRWLDVCDQATELLNRGLSHEARELLEEYDLTNPGQREVLRLLVNVYHEQRDYGPYCQACRRLAEKEPNSPVLHLMLAGGYLNNGRLASALRTFRSFIESWPHDPMVDGARASIEQIEPVMDELLRDMPFAGDERLEFAAMHEEVMACLEIGDFDRAIRFGERLLDQSADFVPVMNNLSEAYFRTGQAEQAMAMSRRVLGLEPDNFHALANLTRHLFLSGYQDKAKELSVQLRSVQSEREEVWYKKCEALSFLGDDEAVLAVFAEAVRAGATKAQTPTNALLHHLAAAASARQGNPRQAASHWRKALKIHPGLDLAQTNLDDAAQKIAERHGPWYFTLDYWVPKETITALCDSLNHLTQDKSDEAVKRTTKRFADSHPEVVSLVPALLDRGDPVGRGFAWRFALMLETPELFEALRTFCLSQRGPDAMRMQTANRLCREGILPPSGVRMWLDGQWKESELFGFEITDEPVESNRRPQVDEWAYQGCQALRRGDGNVAEGFFQKCIDLEGESPDLLNNLALCYSLQGREDESQGLLRKIHARWPDYFFGRIAVANLAIASGDYELAASYLAPLRKRQQLHTTEFSALAAANIRLLILRTNVDAARSWLELWQQVDPEHPQLRSHESMLRRATALTKLRSLLPGHRR